MSKQIAFIIVLGITLGIFSYSIYKLYRYFRLLKPAFPVKDVGKRIKLTLDVVFAQSKIFRLPVIGLLHALVFWGFLVILLGSIEMIIDGVFGTERIFKSWNGFYDLLTAVGDISGFIILIISCVFLFRRLFLNVKRFKGIEMKHKSHLDAIIALVLIILLMISLLGLNTFYILKTGINGEMLHGTFPVSKYFSHWVQGFGNEEIVSLHEWSWWFHIVLIFVFANILPYSKHFHIFMAVPNVFLTRLEPLGKLQNMKNVTHEVKLMLDPAAVNTAEVTVDEDSGRFGVLDVEDTNWKNYLDALACTQCGRCTSVCPANITGKKLSPRKIMLDLRARMKEKGAGLVKEGKEFNDTRSLVKDYVSEEELWACTTCNACAQECPINIDHPKLIVDMRRYLVMEEAAAPVELNTIFTNIENNGAPWQFSPEDRMLWAKDLKIGEKLINVPVLSDTLKEGKKTKYLLWVGSAGAFDERYRKVIRAFVKILTMYGIDYAVLGTEESDSGDIARRAGNEMLFQMQAMTNIEILNAYEIKNILTCDPHDYNVLKNEYPDLGGMYEVMHHTTFLDQLIKEKNIVLNGNGIRVVYHDPCYLGRANKIYDTPREILKKTNVKLTEMRRNRSFALCCGAGGGQMFKEAEKGEKEVFIERAEEALAVNPEVIITACPFCMNMITDGIKYKNKEEEIRNWDVAELVVYALT